jgi:hypothetical protein
MDIEFKVPQQHHSGLDVIALCGKRTVRVRKAPSTERALVMARDLQSDFEKQALPADVEQRIRRQLR